MDINFMHQGEKLKKHLKSMLYTQQELLEKTEFSKSKLYGLYKQSELAPGDIAQLTREFELPKDFFQSVDNANSDNISWEKKYYELLEKYNSCLEEKDAMNKESKSKIQLSNKSISK